MDGGEVVNRTCVIQNWMIHQQWKDTRKDESGSLGKWNTHKEVNQRKLSMYKNSMKMPLLFMLVKKPKCEGLGYDI